jgi:hypothetical protein
LSAVGLASYTPDMDDLTRLLQDLVSDIPIDVAAAPLRAGASAAEFALAAGISSSTRKAAETKLSRLLEEALPSDGEFPSADRESALQKLREASVDSFKAKLKAKIERVLERLIDCERESHKIFLQRTLRAAELREINRQIELAKTSHLGGGSLRRLVQEHDKIVTELRSTYQHLVVVADGGQRACKEATAIYDASLHAYGLSVSDIHRSGGTPRTERTVYRHEAGYPELGEEYLATVLAAMDSFAQRVDAVDDLRKAIKADLATLQRAPGDTTLDIVDGALERHPVFRPEVT